MNMTDLDLNLLRAFDAIATEGNVTSAGERIGLSQPAMSNALARLRQLFDDPCSCARRAACAPRHSRSNWHSRCARRCG